MDVKYIASGIASGLISFFVGKPYISLVLYFLGFVLVDFERKEDEFWPYSFAFFLAISLMYNLRMWGVL